MQIAVGKDIISYQLSRLHTSPGLPVMVFLHGWGRTKEDFSQLTAQLAADGISAMLLAVDLPGFGSSSLSRPDGLSLNDYTEILKRFLEKLTIPNVILIGHSFGARVAIRFTSQFPARVEKLVLISAAGIQRRTMRMLLLATGRALFRSVFFAVRDFPFVFRIKNALGAIFGSSDYHSASLPLRKTLEKVFAEDLRREATTIIAPTLFIWGKHDQITPLSDGETYQTIIRNSRLRILDCGHFPFLDQPIECAHLIASFLEHR